MAPSGIDPARGGHTPVFWLFPPALPVDPWGQSPGRLIRDPGRLLKSAFFLVNLADDIADVVAFLVLFLEERVVGLLRLGGLVVIDALDLDGAALGDFLVGLLKADQLG